MAGGHEANALDMHSGSGSPVQAMQIAAKHGLKVVRAAEEHRNRLRRIQPMQLLDASAVDVRPANRMLARVAQHQVLRDNSISTSPPPRTCDVPGLVVSFVV
jgi:hypothetical protein